MTEFELGNLHFWIGGETRRIVRIKGESSGMLLVEDVLGEWDDGLIKSQYLDQRAISEMEALAWLAT